MNNFLIKQENLTPPQPKISTIYTGNQKIVSFGERNIFPIFLLDAVNDSPFQSSILASKRSMIKGAGLKNPKETIKRPNLSETWQELFDKIVTDYVFYEAFAIQAILNKDGKTFSFYHQPVDEVRFAPMNKENKIETAYLSKNWNKWNNKNTESIKMFGSEEPQQGEAYLLYFKRYKPQEYYYSIPDYYSGLYWILADAEISKYYFNFTKNNFSANRYIILPNEVDEDKKMELYEALRTNYSGSENAGNFLLLFGENGVLPQLGELKTNDADLFNAVNDIVLKNLCSANRLSSPTLAGLSTASGFSSKSDELIAAQGLFKLNVINEARQFILKHLNELLAMNGFEKCLEVEDYNLREEFEGSTDENTDKINDASTDANDNNNLQNVDSNE